MKRVLALVLLFLMLAACAQAQTYSLPYLGLRADVPEGWTAGALYEDEWTLLTSQGAEITVYKTEGEKPAAEDYNHAPYENVTFSEKVADCLCMEYTLLSGEEEQPFVRYLLYANDSVYVLTGKGASIEALHESLTEIAQNMVFQPVTQMQTLETSVEIPEAVPDDGRQVPIALENFSSLTLQDQTTVTVKTLPDALVALITPSDELYETADENGLCSFILSTRQEQVYSYTLMVRASSRSSSSLPFSIERRFSLYNAPAAYRSSAIKIDTLGYGKIVSSPEDHAGKAISFRGKIMDVQDVDGLPCLLVYTKNPAKGVWENPVWAQLSSAFAFSLEDIRTFYGDITGVLLPLEGESIPLIACRGLSEE